MRVTRRSGGSIGLLLLTVVVELLVTAVVTRIRRTLVWTGLALVAAVLVAAGAVVSAAARAR